MRDPNVNIVVGRCHHRLDEPLVVAVEHGDIRIAHAGLSVLWGVTPLDKVRVETLVEEAVHQADAMPIQRFGRLDWPMFLYLTRIHLCMTH